MNLNFLKNAFDRLGDQSTILTNIKEATEQTAKAVVPGGDLFDRVDRLVTAFERIEAGAKEGSGGLQQAIVLKLVAPTLKPIGLGLGFIVDALNRLPSGEEAAAKMDALTKGLVVLGDIGKSILKFAGYMILATPLLMVAAIATPVIALTLFTLTQAVMLSTRGLDKDRLESISALGDVGKSLLIIGGSLALLSFIAVPVFKGLLVATGIIGVFSAITFAMDKIGIDPEKLEKMGDALKSIGVSLLILGGTLALMSLAIVPILKGLGLAAGIILVLGGTFFLLDKMQVDRSIKKTSIALMFAAGAIAVLGLSLAFFSAVVPGWEALAMAAAAVAGTALVFAIAGTFAAQIALGSIAMVVAGLSLIVVGFGLQAISKALPDKDRWEYIGQVGAIIGGLALAMTAAGLAAAFILPGAAAMVVAGGALITLGAGLLVFSKINFQKMFSPTGLFGDSGQVTKGFLGIGGGRPKSNMEVMFEAIANSFMINPISLAAMIAGTPAFVLASVAMISIAKAIKEFQDIAETTDLPKLGLNVSLITGVLADTFGEIGKKFPGGGGGILRNLFGSGGSSPVSQGISAVLGMGRALKNIARGMQAMANLKFPTKYDKDGNPIEFETMDSNAPKRVAENTMMIVRGLSETFAWVGTEYPGGRKNLFARIYGGGGQSAVADGISAVMGMGGALTGIAKGFQAMANLKFPTGYDKEGNPTGYEAINLTEALPRVLANTRLIVTGLSEVFGAIGNDPNAKSPGWFGKSTIEKGIEVISGIGMPLYNLAKGVQSMANLKFPTGYDAKGNPTGYESISDPKALKGKLIANTQLLIGALTETVTQIGSDTDTGSWWKGKTSFEKGVEVLTAIGKPYQILGESIGDILDLVGKYDTATFRGKIKDLVMVFTDPQVTGNSIEYTQEQKLMWGAIGSAMKMSGKAMPEISKSINDMDLDKLTESRKMFEALAVLGENEPADILESMGESLEGALSNLADMLAEFKDTVGEGMTAQAESGNALTRAIDTVTGRTAANTSAGSVNVDNSQVVAAVNQLHRALVSQGIKVRGDFL